MPAACVAGSRKHLTVVGPGAITPQPILRRGRGVTIAAVSIARKKRAASQIIVPAIGVILGIALIAGPFVATILRSVSVPTKGGSVLSLSHFIALFGDHRFYDAVGNTLLYGFSAAILSCLMGSVLAWIVTRTDIPGCGMFEVLNLVPFFLSPYVGAVSWIYLLAPHSGILRSSIFTPLGLPPDFIDIYSIGGVIWVLSLFYTPYVYLFLLGPMRHMDPALEDAARVHGASFRETLRRITLPLLAPALLSGALIVFITSAGLFDVPLALAAPKGIRTIPTEIYGLLQYPADYGRASAFGTVVMVATIILTIEQRRFLSRRRFDTVTGKGYRPRAVRLRPLGRNCAFLIELLYVGCSVILPVMALLMVSFSSIWTGALNTKALTLHNYSYVLFDYDLTRTALQNSVILAVTGATIGVVLAVLQADYLRRGRGRMHTVIDALLSVPLGIPGIILGLGFLILFIKTPLYATLWIILIAYVARFFPFATRGISALYLSINPELEQSARASGGSWAQTMWWIVLPLVRPAIIAAWLMLFVIFIRELGATILLYAQGTETISVALIILSERSFGYVAALAVIQLILLLMAFALFRATRSSIVQ